MSEHSVADAELALTHYGLNAEQAKTAVAGLLSRGWSTRALCIGARARFHCEYCGLDLLSGPDAYRAWQEDHIVPKHLGLDLEGDVYALACVTCNVRMKGRWDPRNAVPPNVTREQYIEAIKKHIAEARSKTMTEIEEVRRLLHLPSIAT